MKTAHVMFVDPIPTPYRVPLYQRLHADPVYDLKVFFCAATHVDRGWGVLKTDFPHVVLRGISFTRRDNNISTFHLNPGVIAAILGERPDVLVLCGWAHPTMMLAAATARAAGIPYLVNSESHGAHPRSRAARTVRILLFAPFVRAAAATLATGSRARDYLTELGASPDGVFVFPNACDIEGIELASDRARASGEAERLRTQLAGHRRLVTYVGRLVPAKAVDVLLMALARLAREGEAPACAIAGGGPERDRLQQLARTLRLERVTFLGDLPPDQLPALYAASDVLCLPSYDEPWGVVVNEAMAAGVPVVASESVGAAADLIRPGETGVRFMPGDVDGLAAALEAVLEDGDVLGVRHRTRAVVANWGYGAACASLAAAIEHVRREPEATA